LLTAMTAGAFAGRAYVLARRERGEADLSVALLLDDGSVRWTTARAGAKSTRRFGAALSPFTRYRVVFHRSGSGGKVERIDEASIDRAFAGVHSDLRRMAAAGALSALARDLGGELAEDDGLFHYYDLGLTRIDAADARGAAAEVLRFFVATFEHAGHEVVRERCARCNRPAPMTRSVTYSVDAGGVRCAACGGGSFVLRVAEREALEAVLRGDEGADERFAPWMLRWLAYMASAHARRGSECVLSMVSYWS
jgi:DNA repair protein RecO